MLSGSAVNPLLSPLIPVIFVLSLLQLTPLQSQGLAQFEHHDDLLDERLTSSQKTSKSSAPDRPSNIATTAISVQ